MLQLPIFVQVLFFLCILYTFFIFYKASKSKAAIYFLFAWGAIQTVVSLNGFYLNTEVIPPRFLLVLFPPLLFQFIILIHPIFKKFRNSLNLKTLTLIHIVRIPVEFVLYFLFLEKYVPEIMTFSGRNFDILPGLTAPFIYYFGFIKKKLSKKFIFGWNIISLGFLVFIISNAILSAPSPFQLFGFNQPNIALLYFPIVLLPSVIVSVVLFSHFVTIKRLYKTIYQKNKSLDTNPLFSKS
ncbi:hypothetical protein [Aureivirga sp. CE67]|uniref:hypothetical protein n=1 Tax=Aureivirga sp. CE67 TaxID=1788983 RepID=UPI0018C913AB|nr:hypothetical protein [Aureivirga sp. CE67]